MKNTKNIPYYKFGNNSINHLPALIKQKKISDNDYAIYCIDEFFKNSYSSLIEKNNEDLVYIIGTKEEPKTSDIDALVKKISKYKSSNPSVIVGMGGGCTLDTAKAVANMITNPGKAEDYQGWDLVKNPGIYKIGIPTISGTGAEASRTCVLMNKKKKLKLGMNSEFTLFDQLILDPELTSTVHRDQYFYTGLDTYIHCIESLNGSYRHPVADSLSMEALRLSREVFLGNEDMMSNSNRQKLMVASYLGGSAIANSFVGVVHPLSAGLSVVLGIHHCLANCLIMNQMEEYYPKETEEFQMFLNKNNINLPERITSSLSDNDFNELYDSSIIHEIPLKNALGDNFNSILTKEKVIEFFQKI